MKVQKDKVEILIQQLDEIIDKVREEEKKSLSEIKGVSAEYKKSAINLIHYRAFRTFDLRKIQKKLGYMGMSRLNLAGGHVLASLLNTKQILQALIEEESPNEKAKLSIKNAIKLLRNHSEYILGKPSKGRRVRIMVTQPTEAAYDYDLVRSMVQNGMNCARVNCAHDGPEVWEKIISNVKRAAEELDRDVKIAMDLAGPKIRTGQLVPGAKVRKFSPERDEMGQLISPAVIILEAHVSQESEPNVIPVPMDWLQQLEPEDQISFIDTRSQKRVLKVMEVKDDRVLVHCYNTSYIGTGTALRLHREQLKEARVGDMPPIEQSLLLGVDDKVTIHKDHILGEPAKFDDDGNLLRQAHIGCQLDAVFGNVKAGERILFDDGKIAGVIEETGDKSFEVRIIRAKELGAKLKAEKGINFPTTDLGISGLTAKDKEDLKFVATHADMVNFSFVNSKKDVEELLTELEKLGVTNKLNIILKIETRQAFDNLIEILLAAMKVHYVGVMIARGDLAVETGWDNIGWVQKEILSLCNAAHIPVVWATQVLENLAKKGLPSRSEITDATTSLKAECVMLNKGAYINNAISLLSTILTDMEAFQEKNEAMLPQLHRLLV